MRIITVAGNNYSRVTDLLQDDARDLSAVTETVKAIIKDIRGHGDVAVVAYTNRLDRNSLKAENLRITPAEINAAYTGTTRELIKALELSASRIEAYYKMFKPEDLTYTDDLGVTLGARYVPIEAVGIYVPGGKANYPSSVLMSAIPARVAGVSRIAMACPAVGGEDNPTVLAAAKICGIDEIYRVGGAQAIAALALGTQSIDRVDKIVGPGNAYVAEAKRQLFGEVGIDMIAGPSEIVVIADENNNPEWIAADLLSQAEHDESAKSILITTSQSFAQKVIGAVYESLPSLERRSIAQQSIERRGLVVVVESISEAIHIANLIAPEHLELAVSNIDEVLPHIINAGAIFLGPYTPEAIGDYIAGPSHVLPTVASARFSSGLSVTDFLKRQSIISCSQEAFAKLAPATIALAKAEGLTAHAQSVAKREPVPDGKRTNKNLKV